MKGAKGNDFEAFVIFVKTSWLQAQFVLREAARGLAYAIIEMKAHSRPSCSRPTSILALCVAPFHSFL